MYSQRLFSFLKGKGYYLCILRWPKPNMLLGRPCLLLGASRGALHFNTTSLAESLYFSFTDQGVAGTASGSVWYINWAEGSRVKLVYGHAGQVVGGATSSDGLLLATCCLDGSVAVWNMESLEQTVVFQAPKKVNPLPTTESCRHLTITSRNVCVSRLLHLHS